MYKNIGVHIKCRYTFVKFFQIVCNSAGTNSYNTSRLRYLSKVASEIFLLVQLYEYLKIKNHKTKKINYDVIYYLPTTFHVLLRVPI